MFTINEFKFTDSNTRYFSNINHLAKDIKKLFDFLSNRELTIFNDLDKIKHTQLLQVISKSLGFYNYDEANTISIITIEDINKIFKYVSEYIYETTKIKEEFVNEVFTMLLLNVKHPNKSNLKTSITKKINMRIEKLEIFYKLDIYSDKKRTKLQKKEIEDYRVQISIEDYQKLEDIWMAFKYVYSTYKTISEKMYRYVWYPYAFERQNNYFSFEDIEKNSIVLKKIGIYQHFIDLKKFIPEKIIARNLNLWGNGNIEESYYVQEKKPNEYVEIIIQEHEDNLRHHGGLYVIVGPSPLEALKKAHLKKKIGDNEMLKKITWNEQDYFFTEIHTYNDSMIFYICEDFMIFDLFKKKSEDETVKKLFIFMHEFEKIESICNFGPKTYNTCNMKNFFLYKTEKDFLEYRLIFDNKIIYKIEFKINELVIKTPEKRWSFTYNELFLDIDKSIRI